MPAPLIIWGIAAGVSALAGLGYAGYRTWDEQESAKADEQRAREAAREEHAKREKAEQQAQYQKRLRTVKTQVIQELKALGLSLKREPSLNELMAWAGLHDDDAVLLQAKEDAAGSVLFALLALPPEQEKSLVCLLTAMGEAIELEGENPLLVRIGKLRHLDQQYQPLKALEAQVTQALARA